MYAGRTAVELLQRWPLDKDLSVASVFPAKAVRPLGAGRGPRRDFGGFCVHRGTISFIKIMGTLGGGMP